MTNDEKQTIKCIDEIDGILGEYTVNQALSALSSLYVDLCTDSEVSLAHAQEHIRKCFARLMPLEEKDLN